MAQTEGEFIKATEARTLLGVSRTRMTTLLKKRLHVYERGIDARAKWVLRSDVENLKQELEAPREPVAR